MPKRGIQSHIQSNTTPIFRIAIPTPLRREFDYLPPAEGIPDVVKPGVRVLVPFGRSTKVGVITAIVESSEFAPSQLKRIQSVLDPEPLLTPDLLELLNWASRYYEYPAGEVMSLALPVLLRQGRSAECKGQEVWTLTAQGRDVDAQVLKRSPRQAALLAQLQNQPSGLSAEQLNAGESAAGKGLGYSQ
jgi:primosomal protein N' (replication factor Y)